MSVTVIHADCFDAIKAMPENSIDSVCTDPPYSINFMNRSWDTGEVAFNVDFWKEALRVLKPGAHLVAFGGARTYHRLVCAIEDAGFEVRDRIRFEQSFDTKYGTFISGLGDSQRGILFELLNDYADGGLELAWEFGQGFPKSLDVSKAIDKAEGAVREVIGYDASKARPNKDGYAKVTAAVGDRQGNAGHKDNGATITAPATDAARQWEGWGTALKPAHEPIVLARKPLSESTVAANVLKWGTGAINIADCRIAPAEGARPARSTERSASGLIGKGGAVTYGHFAVRGSVAVGETTEGRWPANVIHDGSESVVNQYPQSNGQLADAKDDGSPKSGNVYGKMRHRDGEASKDRRYTDEGVTYFAMKPGARRGDAGSAARFFYAGKASRADRAGSKHPTVKPISILEWLVTLITPLGGTVLDPFAGSGTTGAAARNKGFNCILIEREAEYIADINRRLAMPIGNAEPKRSIHTTKANVPADLGPLFAAMENK